MVLAVIAATNCFTPNRPMTPVRVRTNPQNLRPGISKGMTGVSAPPVLLSHTRPYTGPSAGPTKPRIRSGHSPIGRTSKPPQPERYSERQIDTRPLPQEPEIWLSRARAATTFEDTLLYLNQALLVDPYHPVAGRRMDEGLQYLLNHNAFLGYVNETEAVYQVETGGKLVLHIPKNRAVLEHYPSRPPSPLRPAFRWLGLALVGLPLAGIGTLIGLPIALVYAVRAHQQPLSRADRVRANVLIVITLSLIFLAFGLALLLILHL